MRSLDFDERAAARSGRPAGGQYADTHLGCQGVSYDLGETIRNTAGRASFKSVSHSRYVAIPRASSLRPDDQRLHRGAAATALEPVDAFAHQIELQRITPRRFGRRDLDREVGPVARAERLRQPCAGEVA